MLNFWSLLILKTFLENLHCSIVNYRFNRSFSSTTWTLTFSFWFVFIFNCKNSTGNERISWTWISRYSFTAYFLLSLMLLCSGTFLRGDSTSICFKFKSLSWWRLVSNLRFSRINWNWVSSWIWYTDVSVLSF